MKFCRDCKWCDTESWACGCPNIAGVIHRDIVRGCIEPNERDCDALRDNFSVLGVCGYKGKYWEPKEKLPSCAKA